MANKQIRTGQLIAPFGPGSIYTDRRGIPHIIAGLDHWYYQWNANLGRMELCSNRDHFVVNEFRLSTLLRVNHFRSPPDYRAFHRNHPNDQPPPNSNLFIPALRFPRWYRHTRTGQMRRFNLDATQLPYPCGGGRWQPVRFVSVCAAGHLCEFPWKEWIGCQCPGYEALFLTDRGGSELSSIRIECRTCPDNSPRRLGRDLAGTTSIPNVEHGEQSVFQREGIYCPRDRPWLGEGSNDQQCDQPLVAALINQTNLYFPRTISAISLPDMQPQNQAITTLKNEIAALPTVGRAKTIWNMGLEYQEISIKTVKDELDKIEIKNDSEEVREALESLFDTQVTQLPDGMVQPAHPESELVAFRRTEFNIIRHEVNDPEGVPNLRVISSDVPEDLSSWLANVTLVERLKETRVFLWV